MKECMLTTFDNPWNPFEDFDKWLAFDMNQGYNTLQYLDRLCPHSSEQLGDFQDKAYDEAMNAIIRFEPLTYHKVWGEG